ncbi:MAG: hypothetical protein Q3999_08455 [Buchananella hordeovulneris]|nr:hypothetical protein [Buchananella hordeovulneris]
MEFLGIYIDPVALSVIGGVIWPLLQAVIDQPRWSAHTRRLIVIAAGAVLTGLVWVATAYPLHWATLAATATAFIGAATTAFTLLKRAGLIDWIGRITPGGQPRHRLDPADARSQIANDHAPAGSGGVGGEHRPR